MKYNSEKILIVLGMHRSGTSLVARWLHLNGIDMGEKLVGASTGNPHGHFENLDIYRLHTGILRELGLDFRASRSIQSKIPKRFERTALDIIQSNFRNNHQWGWKEPRTCLFINRWLETNT